MTRGMRTVGSTKPIGSKGVPAGQPDLDLKQRRRRIELVVTSSGIVLAAVVSVVVLGWSGAESSPTSPDPCRASLSWVPEPAWDGTDAQPC